MRKEEAHRLYSEMRLGWNLGNTLDAPRGETSWRNPVTTPDMIKALKKEGFNTVRIPVSWHMHMDEEHNIHPDFMERVGQIIGYVMDEGMYAIVNVHHDDFCFQPTDEGHERGVKYLKDVWRQVSERFKDADPDRLIFEGMNEPRMVRDPNEWHLDMRDERSRAAAEYINEFNQAFVDTVRASGGNNLQRLLMTPSYAAGPAHAFMPEFRVPNDPSERTIVSIHVYDPQGLALMPDPGNTVFDEHAEKVIDYILDSANKKFVSQGVPVIIGEMGIVDKNNPEDRYKWCRYFVNKAKEYDILCVWWDNGGREFKLLNRYTLEIYGCAVPVVKGLIEGLE